MKTIRLLFLFLVLSSEMNAQVNRSHSIRIFSNSEIERSIKLKHDFQVFDQIQFLLQPLFGGLFDGSFKQVRDISNLKKFYTHSDLGFNLALNSKMNEHLNFKAMCNVGVLKFSDSDSLKAKSYIIKISINYVF